MSLPQTLFVVDIIADERFPTLAGYCRFKASRAGEVNGIALWFDALLAPNVHLSSGPWTRTHWQQCFAPIETPIWVEKGQQLEVTVSMRLRESRGDEFKFSFEMTKRN